MKKRAKILNVMDVYLWSNPVEEGQNDFRKMAASLLF